MAENNKADSGKKTHSITTYILTAIYIAVAAILYWFWVVPYRAALGYREQLQLFQTTGAYFLSMLPRAGGMATYIGEFLTQFFNNYWIGAAIMSGMLALFLLSCYKMIRKSAPFMSKYAALALAFIPLDALLLFLGNPDVTMNFIVAITAVMWLSCLYFQLDAYNAKAKQQAIKEYILMALFTSLLYWLCGPATIIFTLLATVSFCKKGAASIAYKATFTIVALIWFATNFWIWSLTLHYPVTYQLIGIGYMMMPDRLYAGELIVIALCVLIPSVASLTARLPHKILIPTLIGIELIALVALFSKAYDTTTYRLIDYDYMVRANDWEGILRYSDAHDPDLPLSVSATNLAAAMTGQLDARAFNYRQHGSEGLIPPFIKETLSSWTTGEIFFQLGLVNSAQRFYFEGMEAIPNYNKSSRAIRRLAETAIIRGNYTLADKYLRLLENTLFYKKWAQRNLELILNPKNVESHPLYGTLRKRMIDEDYLFSEGELDKTLGQLFLKDPGNNPAKQYLIVYPLLQRDLNKFAQYMGVVAEADPSYNPLLAQQALAFISMKNGQAIPQGAVPESVVNALRGFASAWTSKNPDLIEPYRRTLFHYLLSEE